MSSSFNWGYRLVGEVDDGVGIVEVSFESLEQVFSICPDEKWTSDSATSICQLLGYESGRVQK